MLYVITRRYLLFSLYIFLFFSFGSYSQIYAMNEYKGCLNQKYNFECVSNIKQMEDLCGRLERCKAFALDTETTGFNPVTCDCIGISICIYEGDSYYIPFGHILRSLEKLGTPQDRLQLGAQRGEQLSRQQVVRYLKPIFENENIGKYFHHAVFDMLFLYAMGIDVKGSIFCSYLAAFCIDPDAKHDLKSLSEKHFGETMISFKEAVLDNGCKDFSEVPLDLATKYAAADAHQTLKLVKVFEKKLGQEESLQDIYKKILLQEKISYESKKKVIQEHKADEDLFPREAKKRLRDEIVRLRKRRKKSNQFF